MKSIGIKLADGTFYPIMEDGKPNKKQLDLTTVKDGQTTVNIDLYRSEDGSLDESGYVDTLQIKNLNSHPNGEPNLALVINLDENNVLSAEVTDPETGSSTSTSVELVSRSLAERSEPTDFAIDGKFQLPEVNDVYDGKAPQPDAADSPEQEAEASGQEGTEPEPQASEDATEFSMPDFDAPTAEESAAGLAGEGQPESDAGIAEPEPKDESPMPESDDPNSEVLSEKSGLASAETIFDLPDFDDSAITMMDSQGAGKAASSSGLFSDEEFSVPDFENSQFDMPSEDDIFSSTDFDLSESAAMPAATASPAAASSSAGIDFSDLYDKETLDGKSYEDEEESSGGKGRGAVIICVLCALICIVATLLMLFVLPTKFNLLATQDTKLSQTTEKAEAVVRPVVPAGKEAEELPPPPAQEDVIVISPTPKVVPVQPKPNPEKKGQSVTHTVAWGDTLWDLAETYYRNPWKYTYIAEYNHIKDPNVIFSGTKIEIPAE